MSHSPRAANSFTHPCPPAFFGPISRPHIVPPSCVGDFRCLVTASVMTRLRGAPGRLAAVDPRVDAEVECKCRGVAGSPVPPFPPSAPHQSIHHRSGAAGQPPKCHRAPGLIASLPKAPSQPQLTSAPGNKDASCPQKAAPLSHP